MLLVTAFFVLGAVIGGQINHAIYRFAFFSRRLISPWMKPHPDAAPRSFIDYVPILGWCFLNREEKIHGNLFWLRPFLIELMSGCVVAGLYLFHIENSGPVPDDVNVAESTRWAWLAAQTVLFALLAIATFIDFDEFMIPDQVTIPGVVFCVVFAAIYPPVLLPHVIRGNEATEPLSFASPLDPAVFWYGSSGLAMAVACLWFWCFALLPKICTMRYGWRRFFPLMIASILRPPRQRSGTIPIAPRRMYWGTPLLATIALLGTVGICIFWLAAADDHQKIGLLTALIGMAFGMGMIWSIRILGKLALGKEAMGFGDVTLMAMIGAYVGWQACLPILAASAGIALFVSVPLAIIHRESTLPYGPYLSLGAVWIILAWNSVWEGYFRDIFAAFEPQFLLLILVAMTVPMFALLLITRFVKERLLGIR